MLRGIVFRGKAADLEDFLATAGEDGHAGPHKA